jgi:hypothetical protein
VNRLLVALLLRAGCGETVVERPVMAPVDTARTQRTPVPKAARAECEPPAWDPITLPTTAAEQVAGRHADRARAEAIIAECDGRRSSAVQAIRRGATR